MKRNLIGYVQCDIELPQKLRANFANFPPIFKNFLFSKNDIGDLMKTYVEEEAIMSQPRKKLDIKLHIAKRNSDYYFAFVLSATGAGCFKKTSF